VKVERIEFGVDCSFDPPLSFMEVKFTVPALYRSHVIMIRYLPSGIEHAACEAAKAARDWAERHLEKAA